MHHLHNEILMNLENDRVTREAELHFQRLRDAGIEPGTSHTSLLSWLHRDRYSEPRRLRSPRNGRLEARPTHRPRPV
jgi:hypothetical protein